ncbi:MAG TPA: GNAT family N-acetyltransferase [Burkholderiaceae bacterium]
MDAVFRVAEERDLAELWALFDREFIISRGRAISLRERYPATYAADNVKGLYLARTPDGALAACLAARTFSMCHGGATLRGAMLGGVCTDAPYRRQGMGGALLRWSAAHLRETGIEFAVLWSARQDFYRRLGWQQAGGGVLGRVTGDRKDAALRVEVMPAAACDVQYIEAIRAQYLDTRVLRSADDYAQLPIPADAVDLFLWRDAGNAAYALAGRSAAQAIVYEMVGAEQGFAALWQAVRSGHADVLINDCRGSASFSWLSRHAAIAWEDKPLALWMPLAGAADAVGHGQWHIPYFDRV